MTSIHSTSTMANHEATTIDSSERSIPTQQRQSSSSDNSSPTTVTELLLLQAGPQLPLSPNSVVEKFQKETTTATTTTTTTKPKSAKTLQTVVGASIDSLPSSPVIDYEATSIDDDVEDEDFDDVWSVSCGSFRSDNNNKKTLSVRFSPLVRVKDTLSQHDMTLKEHFDYWLQDHDFLVIKQRNQEIIKAFEERIAKSGNSDSDNSSDDHVVVVAQKQQRPTRTPSCGPLVDTTMECSENDSDSENNDNDVHCLRGLESCLQNENLRKRSFRFASLEEVFLEQEDQYYSGIYDDRAIATVYGEVTCECKFRAELRGRQDRRDIEEYLLLSSYLASERTR